MVRASSIARISTVSLHLRGARLSKACAPRSSPPSPRSRTRLSVSLLVSVSRTAVLSLRIFPEKATTCRSTAWCLCAADVCVTSQECGTHSCVVHSTLVVLLVVQRRVPSTEQKGPRPLRCSLQYIITHGRGSGRFVRGRSRGVRVARSRT